MKSIVKGEGMFKLTLSGEHYSCRQDETVLDALLRQNVNISYACKSGTCHSCLVRSVDVMPSTLAQVGLKDTLKNHRYFLACQCHPEQDMTIKLPDQDDFYAEGTVVVKRLLNKNTILLIIAVNDTFAFNAGQFVNLQRSDGLTRSYSIACIPNHTNTLEFHIRRLPGGLFSTWLHDELKVGDAIAVSEPRGHSFYMPERSEQNLLLVGTGTGLAPLAGILADALTQGHSGSIHLFHGSREIEDLYKIEEMRELARQHKNVHYTPCLSGKHVPEGFAPGRVHNVALASINDLKGWRVFLCGHPEMVKQMQKLTFLKGASMADIYADAFFVSQAQLDPERMAI